MKEIQVHIGRQIQSVEASLDGFLLGEGNGVELTAENIADALGYVPADQEDVDRLSEEIANLSLGKHTDGLVYIFMNGEPVGNGLNISGGTVGDSDNIALSDGVLTILSLANEPALADSVLSIA